jgi:hypothetical protein
MSKTNSASQYQTNIISEIERSHILSQSTVTPLSRTN